MKKNWQTKKLSEVCDIQTGKWDANHAIENGKYRFYTCAYKHGFCNTKRFSGECLILPGNGVNVGEVFFYQGDLDAYQRTYVINNINIYPKLLYYHLLCFWKERNLNKQFGSATNFLKIGNFSNYEIFYPKSLSEQHRIVKILDDVFEKTTKAKENVEKNLQNVRELFESYLQSIFANPGDGWENKKLGEVCVDVEYGTSAKSSKTGKIPVLRMGNIQGGKLDWNDLVYTSDDEEIQKYALKKNDILFNRTNSEELVGKTVIYKGERPAIFAGYLIRINIKKYLVDADFLNICLNSEKLREYGFSVMTSSVNQANISGSKLKEYPIVLPPLSEQKRIVAKLDILSTETEKLEAIYQQKLADLEELKKSILQKVFNGEFAGVC